MKANELMIGDWVVYNGDVDYINPIKIEGMDIATGMCVTTDRDDVGFDGVWPIYLTAEILEKNGAWCEHNIGYVMEEGENEIIYDLFDHKLRILKNREQILNLEYLWDEMCVHELQHALRLCNIEKEIEL